MLLKSILFLINTVARTWLPVCRLHVRELSDSQGKEGWYEHSFKNVELPNIGQFYDYIL